MAMARYSKQRDMILNELRRRSDHPTAEMIYTALKAENAALSLGTVYRNLKKLAKDNVIGRLDFQVERYDAYTELHTHIKCAVCGGVFDLLVPYDRGLDEGAEAVGVGCEIERHELIFYGRCGECVSSNPDLSEESVKREC